MKGLPTPSHPISGSLLIDPAWYDALSKLRKDADSAYPEPAPIDITGSRSDGSALANLLQALEQLGLVTDSTTA